MATPFINFIRSTPNEYTQAKPGSVENIIITDENTLNGTDNRDATNGRMMDPVAGHLPLNLVNNFAGGPLNAYISGQDSNGRVVFLRRDGGLHYPTSGGSLIPIPVNHDEIAIPLPRRGQTLTITLPIAMSSGRIYFCEGDLRFFMVWTGWGDGLVQPSIVNLQDPSAGLNWGFVELTLTTRGVIWANISFVDYVGLAVGMVLRSLSGTVQEVLGLRSTALESICANLGRQGQVDGRPWAAHCIVRGGRLLRALSPKDYADIDPTAFEDYWTGYVDAVWEHYRHNTLRVNLQNELGVVACRVNYRDELACEGDSRPYGKPTAGDIWGCNSGPFTVWESDNGVHRAVVPRLCAAFTRTTLLLPGGDYQPGLDAEHYYTRSPTSHYSRIVHEHVIGGRGYTFPYDDVNPDGAEDAAGLITSPDPESLTFFVGGAEVRSG
ncbi:glucanase B [Sodiomyces alkalinus F11]|uniref:Glucanase B n=1 Tax=Sodiomyces alkalinus (strain CBS 110278 / VKM F-3762 / F11) TaxID=1314773 RepID=A0A3N2PUW0_SODAK|nr:glucanase B [Sodiomyces alkalinus F11]ROT38136.1 glucanase B [Sodiomyces alkalinus F11]